MLTLRRQYQSLMEADASKAVAEITGRRVMSFMSDTATRPDIAAEIFVLDGPPERAPLASV